MRKFNIVISILLASLVFLLFSCSSSVPEVKKIEKISEGIYKDNLRINVNKIVSWVNLMPGASPRFHITGSIDLLDNSEYDIKNATIKKISIMQNNNSIYNFTPKIEETFVENRKSLLFSTIRGLLLTSILDREKPINVELLISDSSREVKYLIPDVEISEAH